VQQIAKMARLFLPAADEKIFEITETVIFIAH
jgi:hypothetical protein